MRRRLVSILLLFILIFVITTPALAQEYYFQLPRLTVDAYWETDGSLTLDYEFYFVNTPSGHSIEYVDLGMPNNNYSDSNIIAWVDGDQVYDISSSGFQGIGSSGVAIGLGQYSIPPGKSGTVKIHAVGIQGVVYKDSKDSNYVSADFYPAYFERKIVEGTTDFTLTYHFPPDVKPEEPRWHNAPDAFPSEPETGFDDQNRIIYRWHNPNANGYTQYKFGASFPKSNVPASTIVTQNPFAGIGKFISGAILPILCIGGFIAIVASGLVSNKNRKQQYLPPIISIEGHGIKRGLTAVEAAILLEQPLDKVMTMILFSVIKKNAAEVVTRDPLEINVKEPLPSEMQAYETNFLEAFKKPATERSKALQDTILSLVKSVSGKMKGFSRVETIAYYRDITKRAWEQVEAANTPEVKSQKYDEVMEWTMLDKDYKGRTEDVFRNTPVYIPVWWGRYDPGLGRVGSGPSTTTVSSGGGVSRVPGTDFATSVVTGVDTFSSKVVGNINDFTSKIAGVTNPAPKPSSTTYHSGGGGGGGGHSCVCACACACAGCACACAGGGR